MRLHLVIAWSQEFPYRVGESFVLPLEQRRVVGRSLDALRPVRRRPSGDEPRSPIADSTVSREHLEVRASQRWLTIRRIGRRSVLVDGHELEPGPSVRAGPGSQILLGGKLLLVVVESPPLDGSIEAEHGFGQPDRDGIVGESAATWRLRQRIASFGPRSPHVLIAGESGVGKELAARALHRASRRAEGPFVSRNASMFPDGIIDAELLGNPKNYPNPGMPDREGLIGASDGGTLFLDEIADLPLSLQPKLLRVMDAGEYSRLGETRIRISDLRFLGATHRSTDAIRHDLAARFEIKLSIPPLRERPSDIPVILRQVVIAMCRDDHGLAAQLLDDDGEPRLRASGVGWLLQQPLPTNVRGIRAAVWDALMDWFEYDEPLDLQPCRPAQPTADAPNEPSFRTPREIPCGEVAEVMANAKTLQEAVERLRIRDRHVLKRLRQRCGLMDG